MKFVNLYVDETFDKLLRLTASYVGLLFMRFT